MFFYFSYFPSDPPYVTDDLRNKGAFKDALQTLRSELEELQKDLSKSVPFFSSRYKVTWFCIEHCKAETTDFHFANYRFSFRKLQISISQTTDFHFVSFNFVSSHFVSQTTVSHIWCYHMLMSSTQPQSRK